MNKKPTYEELERSLKELDRIFNLSIDMIGSGNLDGYFTKINSSFKQILGYTEEEILENPFILFVHDEDIEKTKKALADAIEGKKDICIENRYKCKDGSYKWIEWKILSIIQDNKFIAVGREITERKWAEKAILQNEHILNQSQGVSNVGSFSLDIEKNQVFWSKQLYKIFGYEHGEVQPDFDLVVSHIHPDDKDSFIQSNQISLSGKRDYDEVYRIIRKDGEVRTVHSKAKVEFDVSGNPLRTYGALQDITNRKQKEEALQASEHFLKNVFDSIQDGISVLDTDLNIIKTNRWMEKAYTKKMPFAGQKCYQVYQERKSPCPWCPTLQTIQTGEANTQIVPYPSDEDPIGWIELTAFPIKDETGHITSIIEYVKDITDRKQTEEAIRKSEEKFSKVFHCGPAIEGISDLETGEYIEVNQAFYDKLGFTTKEVIGKKSTEVVHLDDKFRARMIAKMKRHGQIKNEDGIIYTKTGTPMNVLFSAEIIEFAGKKYNYSTVIDITDLKHAEKALRESEKRLRQISDTTFEGIVLHNHGEIIYANDQYYNIFGYTKEELSGVDAISLTVSPNSIKKMKKLISSGNLGPYEVIGIKKNGDKFPIEIHAKISEYHGQKIRLAAIRDITRYKQAEEDTRKALEYAAEQSKHSLIGQVAGKMAHDFNNVLMGIMGNAQLALLNCDDEKTKKRLENINEFSERGKDITSNLMSFSKDQEPKQTYFKIENKIELVLKMLEKDMAGIEVSRNYKKGIPELLADPGMIQDVLTNLIQNSIHAMSKVKNPTLSLKVYSQDSKVYFEIEDNGCGIPKEHQNSIYTPSFTLKGSHDKTGSYKLGIKGTGYGMSNVKKYIVEKHKGDISLESEVGKGTKITIALIIIKRQLSSDEKKAVVKNQIYDKRRILLVEDEHAIADVQYQILTNEPFSHIVSMAVNGQMAIDTFDRNKFDAVSLDYMLPGNINGLDVYNHIRENDKDIPVVFISGNIEFIASMKKIKEKDPNIDHLSKPVNNLDYVNKVNELIGKSIK